LDKLIEVFRRPSTWTVSVQLLILYCVSVGLFYLVDAGNRSAAEPLKAGVRSGKALNQAVVFAVAAASNALAVLTFVFICRRVAVVPRLAMVGLPLLLLIEQHVRAARSHREDRRLEALLAAGMAIGIIGAVLALMRGSPLK
jgi:hypothetical protein